MMVQNRWPSDKANHNCEMPSYKLLYIIQVKGSSWPYLISKILVTYNYSYNAASDRPYTFTARLFYLGIHREMLVKVRYLELVIS